MIRRKERERASPNASFLLEFYRGTNIQKSIILFSFIVSTVKEFIIAIKLMGWFFSSALFVFVLLRTAHVKKM